MAEKVLLLLPQVDVLAFALCLGHPAMEVAQKHFWPKKAWLTMAPEQTPEQKGYRQYV